MKIGFGMWIMILIGAASMLGVAALAIWALCSPTSDADTRKGAWMAIVLIGGPGLLVLYRLPRLFLRGATVDIDEKSGVTNLTDRIGPVAWHEIQSASIEATGYARYVGTIYTLFIEVTDDVAGRHLANADWLTRLSPRRRPRSGVTELAIMSSPPYSKDDIDATMRTILTHTQTATNSLKPPIEEKKTSLRLVPQLNSKGLLKCPKCSHENQPQALVCNLCQIVLRKET